MVAIIGAAMADLPGIPSPPKKRGRPSTGRSASAAERKRAQRQRIQERLNDFELRPEDWTEAECLLALANGQWKGRPLGQKAWRRLGEIWGYSQ